MNASAAIVTESAAEHSVFAVPGLRCAGCIAKLEHGLAPLPGVIAARVNFTSRQLAVDHSPELRLPDL
jgi:Cu2+-exporting ATPase